MLSWAGWPNLGERQARTDATLHRGRQQLQRLRPRFAHVDMGIGLVGERDIGDLRDLRREIGMEVEGDRERRVLANEIAAKLTQKAQLGRRIALGHQRSVQRKIDGVVRLVARLERRQTELIKQRILDWAPGRRRRREKHLRLPIGIAVEEPE